MKYFFVIALFFITAGSVFAAPGPSGTVPVLPPLLAPQPNVKPNLGNNIQLSDPSHPVDSGQQVQPTNSPDTNSQNNLIPVLLAQPYEKSNIWIWVVLILAGFMVIVFFIIKAAKKE